MNISALFYYAESDTFLRYYAIYSDVSLLFTQKLMQCCTSYGPSGPRGKSGAAIFGGSPTDPGMPVTHEDILSGIKQPGGGTFPPAIQIR